MRIGLVKGHTTSKVKADSKLNGEINVTPLVDVCLVLLIIFMVVTPMLQKGIDVSLPTTKSPEEKVDNDKQLILAVRTDKSLYIGSQPFRTKEDFTRELKAKHETNPDREIVVKADKRLEYGDVLDLLKAAHEAGFTNVGLISERIQEGQ